MSFNENEKKTWIKNQSVREYFCTHKMDSCHYSQSFAGMVALMMICVTKEEESHLIKLLVRSYESNPFAEKLFI